MGNYLFKETEEAKRERLLQKSYDYNIELLKIQRQFQAMEAFSKVGISDFNTGTKNLGTLIGLLIEQNKIASNHKICEFTKVQSKQQIDFLVEKMNEINENVTILFNMKEMKKICGKLTNCLHSLSYQLSAKTLNLETLGDQMTEFDFAVDDFNTWFENVKASKRPEFLKNGETERQDNAIETSSDPFSCESLSEAEHKAESYSSSVVSKYRRNDGKVDLKDIKESIMNVNACWKNYAERLENDKEIIREESKKKIKKLYQIKYNPESSGTSESASSNLMTEAIIESIVRFIIIIIFFYYVFSLSFYGAFQWAALTGIFWKVFLYFNPNFIRDYEQKHGLA